MRVTDRRGNSRFLVLPSRAPFTDCGYVQTSDNPLVSVMLLAFCNMRSMAMLLAVQGYYTLISNERSDPCVYV